MKTLIIPAAGLATRLRPITAHTSKAMVLVNGKPIISYILDRYKKFYDQIIIVHGKNNDLPDYIKKNYIDDCVFLTEQQEARGPLDAVYSAWLCPGIKIEGSVTVWLGDTIVMDYNPEEERNSPFVVAGKVDDWSRWCMVDLYGNMYDKPEKKPLTDLALVGIYYNPSFIDSLKVIDDIISSGIRVKGEFQLSQWLEKFQNSVIQTEEWFDCGDIASLYESSGRLLKYNSRPDNTITYDHAKNTITKSGKRVYNECLWYKNIPLSARYCVPQVFNLDESVPSYEMEHLSGTPLDSFFVFQNITDDTYIYILDKVVGLYHDNFYQQSNSVVSYESLENMLFFKNIKRVMEYGKYGIPSREIFHYISYATSILTDYSLDFLRRESCIHGDLHLGNIIFDVNIGKMKFIDPRGEWNGEVTHKGSFIYDIIKLQQSIRGDYIWIYNSIPVDQNKRKKLRIALDMAILKYFDEDILNFAHDFTPVMMGSCLEFHEENPQRQKEIWAKTMQLMGFEK